MKPLSLALSTLCFASTLLSVSAVSFPVVWWKNGATGTSTENTNALLFTDALTALNTQTTAATNVVVVLKEGLTT